VAQHTTTDIQPDTSKCRAPPTCSIPGRELPPHCVDLEEGAHLRTGGAAVDTLVAAVPAAILVHKQHLTRGIALDASLRPAAAAPQHECG